MLLILTLIRYKSKPTDTVTFCLYILAALINVIIMLEKFKNVLLLENLLLHSSTAMEHILHSLAILKILLLIL